MPAKLLLVLLFFLAVPGRPSHAQASGPVPLRGHMVITRSLTIAPGRYRLGASDSGRAVIEIRGSHIVVDFNGAVLAGSPEGVRPDAYRGVAIRLDSGSDVTIRHAVVHGYRVALEARGIRGLRIEDCDFSYNYRQHLNSNRRREDFSDWQSYHHNEHDEWLRFGAGMYLRDCDSAQVCRNRITGGQCALMMTGCDGAVIYDNDFSFNSGIGIGLYRSSHNRVMHNRLDWNVRGVSEGVYYRGQDAAAILVYEQSSHNVFAYNSATHSGDGFFLWAGASTLATGRGGCNDNLIYGNDFSFAPTNGIEATFSRNRIVGNLLEGCDNGLWAGYSHHTLITGNRFIDNRRGIAIEQGRYNTITGNLFRGGETALQLWATPGRAPEGHYDALHDVRSRAYKVQGNTFERVPLALSLRHSDSISVTHNRMRELGDFVRMDSTVRHSTFLFNGPSEAGATGGGDRATAPEDIPDAHGVTDRRRLPCGKHFIMMNDWGPYDFRSPFLWQRGADSAGYLHLDILGPAGRWTLRSVRGAEQLSAREGQVPGRLTLRRTAGPLDLALTYEGAAVTSPLGKYYPAGTPYVFHYRRTGLMQAWTLRLYAFDSTSDPLRQPAAFARLLQSKPLRQASAPLLDNGYWDGSGLPLSHSATVATAQVDFPADRYVIGLSAGEMARLYIDGRLVIDAWDTARVVYDADYHHEQTLHLQGRHRLRIEQAQYGSYGLLYLTMRREAEYLEP